MKFRKSKKTNYILIVFMVIMTSFIMMNKIGENINKHIENIVIKNVNKGVYNCVFFTFGAEGLGDEELLDVIVLNKNNDNEIISVDYNFSVAYKILSNQMEQLYNNIINIDIDSIYEYDKNSIYYFPIGLTTNNILFDSFGFKIPIKVNFISDIDMGFKTKVKDYGVNNVLIELYLAIDVDNSIISPSNYVEFGEHYEIIVASSIVMGRVPSFYGDTIEKSSSIVSS